MASDIIDRIGKLMLQAQDETITEPERAAFRDKALALARREHIDLAFATAHTKKNAKEPTKKERKKGRYQVPLKAPLMQQMNVATDAFRFAGCELIRFGTGRSIKLFAFGYEDDLDVGKVLFDSLITQGKMALATGWANRRNSNEVKRTFARTFWENYRSVIYYRLEDIARATSREAEEAQPGSAIAVRTQEDEIKSWVASMFGETKKARSSGTRKYSEGSSVGREAGYRADLGQPKLTR